MIVTKKHVATAVGTFALGLYLGLTPLAGAASPSQQECEANGGSFSRTNGTVTCTVVDPVGQSEASGGKSQSRDTSDAEKGNTTPKDKNATTSTGPGNSQG
jgi:hypothetical protein